MTHTSSEEVEQTSFSMPSNEDIPENQKLPTVEQLEHLSYLLDDNPPALETLMVSFLMDINDAA
ncbi:hypothetical protein BT96DRAFT_1008169 [Gymnopus androsaceus JB14]|uniref:Uncharacterized protein n=1 Tax=Gymnopus androsaceus JB14 TaxID=1447944 RepID=A0A6A4GFS4_9AGAR|nr:hypothetical protein BT96DRAFT_1008169 [Gymnopus androsaceus JB14]